MKQDARDGLRYGEHVAVEGWSFYVSYRAMLNEREAIVMLPNGQDQLVEADRIGRLRGLDGETPL